MNDLEKAILDGACDAQQRYTDMTGWWLSHAPESFIEHEVAAKVHDTLGFSVFPEASPKKILKEQGKKPRGRPASNLGQRFDIAVWYKTTQTVRAVVEIKRAWAIADLRRDVAKISKVLKQRVGNEPLVDAGYLLVYTEAKGGRQSATLSEAERAQRQADTLKDRLSNWAETLRITMVGHHIDPQGDGVWGWAVALFRVPCRDSAEA